MQQMIEDLQLVLDFVERYNKQDEEHDVAEAAQRLYTAFIAPSHNEI